MASLVKCLLSFENQCIPANLHLQKIKSSIADMCPPLQPINDNYDYTPGIAALNNFGLGGVNGHVILEPNYRTLVDDNNNSLEIATDSYPRIVNICCRTLDGLNRLFDFIENNPQKITKDFLALLTDTMKSRPNLKSSGFPYRGTLIIKQMMATVEDNDVSSGGQQQLVSRTYKRQWTQFTSKSTKPLWFLLPGLGGQWSAMARALMPINIFAQKIDECHEILSEYGINLKTLLLNDSQNQMTTMTNKFCATTALQIAMIDVLHRLDITADGLIGHSFGEIACAYADGCITAKEALLVTYIRGQVTENDRNIPKGLMAVVGMSWMETKKLCPKGVHVVCNNSDNAVVVSGLYKEVKQFTEDLAKRNIFVRELESNYIPYHSKYLKSSAPKMTEMIAKVITSPKKRSKTWISTAIDDQLSSDDNEALKFASAEYFVHNLVSPVYFINKLKTQVPNDAIIIEIGPHSLFAKIVAKTLENSTYMSLIKKDQNDSNCETFLSTIGKLYELGFNPAIEHLYPRVEWPVARNTQSISSLIRWDHSESFLVKKYPDYYFNYTAGDMNIQFDMSRDMKSYLTDHCIDGSAIFPATGYLMLAWRQLAASRGKIWNQLPVVFEETQFRRAVFLSQTEPTKLKVRFHDISGEFAILENNSVVCLGRCYSPDDCPLRIQNIFHEQNIDKELESGVTLDADDIYKELGVKGYDYGPTFRRLRQFCSDSDGSKLYGKVEWDGNWITFLDALFQTMALTVPSRELMVPVMISSLRCDPKVFFSAISDANIVDENVSKVIGAEDREEIIVTKTKQEVDIFSETTTAELLETFIDSSFHKYKSMMSFYCDVNSKIIVTNGLEVEDLIAVPISRKNVSVNDLKLESYQFIANDESQAIDDHQKEFAINYLNVCLSMANKIIIDKFDKDVKDEYILLNIFKHLLKLLTDQKNSDNINNIDSDLINKSISDLYTKPEFDLNNDLVNQLPKCERFLRPLLDIVCENIVPKKEIKVLELSANVSGLMAQEIDTYLASAAIFPIDVDYNIATKSVDQLPDKFKTNKLFKQSYEWNYRKNDFPVDSLQSSFDLIVLRDTQELWPSVDLKKQLHDMYESLNNNNNNRSFLLIILRDNYTAPELALSQMNGKKFADKTALRQRIDSFVTIGKSIGLSLVCRKSDSIGSMGLLFRKTTVCDSSGSYDKQNINFIQIDENCYENWFELVKQKLCELKEITNESDTTKLWLVSIGSDKPSKNGLIGLANSLRLEPGGDRIRCIFDFDNCLQLPLLNNHCPLVADILTNELIINVISNGKVGTYRHLNLPKDYDQLVTHDYFLNVAKNNKDLSSIQWFAANNLFTTEINYDMNNQSYKQIRCRIYSSGLNFKDVMFATGRIMSGPESLFTDNAIGFEFAGRRNDSGQRVCGFGVSRCMASFVDTSDQLVTPIPDHWSMDEAVTVLSTYITVWYGLIERAQLRQNESILIHSGAGGVGQAAIAVCQHYNCDIYTTVGNEEKRRFLIDRYKIPEHKIFNSRDIQFKYQLLTATNGRGVNLVLNSLTGDKLEASFQCVSKNGRFVEIGKYDLILNKRLGLFAFLKNISFVGVSVDQIISVMPDYCQKFFDWMHQNSAVGTGCVRPINTTIFRASEADQAFRYMTTGKHIGKLVIKIRDEEPPKTTPMMTASQLMNETQKLMVTVKTYFNPQKVFIITGGLGGFGLELINWMVKMGAKKFVITSRSGIKTSYQRFLMNRLDSWGQKYRALKTDLVVVENAGKTLDDNKNLLAKALELGPLGGVFHLALVLNDGLLENQTLDQFVTTCASKVNACQHLDRLTREMSIDLDYFVVFSSVSCGKGNPGQTNYSYGNSVGERLCEQRRRDGLHGLAIQWGPIGDVGVIADTDINTSFSAIVKQRINSCMEVLDKFLQCPHPILSSTVRAQRIAHEGTREYRIVGQIWSALGVDPDTTPDHLTLGEIGIESMFAIELQQGLEKDYDIKISLSDVKSITVKQMKDFQSGKVVDLKQFAADIRDARHRLNRKRFIIPSEPYTRLNTVTSGKPLYLLPPIEGIFSTFESLAKKIDRPVIGLNWTKDMDGMTSINEMATHFTQVLRQLSPTGSGDWDIIGHFYGALVASKMLRSSAPIGRAVIIDILSNTRIDEELMASDENLFKIVSKFLFHDMPENVRQRISRDLDTVPDIGEKLTRLSTEIKDFGGKSLVSKDLDQILKNSFRRAKLFTDYRIKLSRKYQRVRTNVGKKFYEKRGKLLVIKPFEDFGKDDSNSNNNNNNNHNNIHSDIDGIYNSYFISKEASDMMDIQKLRANPDEILIENVDKIATLINNFFKKI
ncbi:fatty acid synthase-like [Oppia nitens]|uniref:fatty acid synthase-like n=1 Tax=Oppia nitens TaxID=1686743 RepID=UPI0023D987B1|nr:fatty acid synthase-like [Oppia nitens]